MKITPETTLADIQLEAGKRGVEMITTKFYAGKTLAGLWVQDDLIMGEGQTLDAALDDGFAKLDKKRGDAFMPKVNS